MSIKVDRIEGLAAINKLIERLSQIPTIDQLYMKEFYSLLREFHKAIHIHSYDIDSINNVYQLLIDNNIHNIRETEFDIIVPWNKINEKSVNYAVTYVKFKELGVNENDVPQIKLRSVVLMTEEEFLKKYPSNRLTEYALGSKYYVNALRTEENLFKLHKCIVCYGSFQEIEKLREILTEQSIPCANLNMDVLCIVPNTHIEYLYKLIQGGMYLMELSSN